jgi:putative Mg2+ transporter-C (MgtC) family protein
MRSRSARAPTLRGVLVGPGTEVDVVSEVEALIRMVLAVGLGAIIGLDRETRAKPAGLRTFAIVSLGACIFTLVGELAFPNDAETSRVVSTIITGVGFLGAGTILHRRSDVVGLTTAAGIWASAGIGMAVGMGLYLLATGGAVLIVVVLWLFGKLSARISGDEGDDKDGSDDADGEDEKDRTGEEGEESTRPSRFDRPEDVAKA